MKRFVIALMVAFAFFSTGWGQEKETILKDTMGTVKVTVTKTTPAKAEKKTGNGIAYSDIVDSAKTEKSHWDDSVVVSDFSDDFPFNIGRDTINGGIALSAFVIIIVFGFPIVIIFMAFYFRYKNKKAKYKLIEQALASGQPLPEGLLKAQEVHDYRAAGIKNTFMGLGLFIFLWAITGKFAIGCIGLLIMCIGLGKWVTSIDRNRSDKDK